ncbi:hypothetical protein [Streptococcus acidominimus]|uniref:Uncharacterized protein n=1 Tax=Streptococcus acidominimus TaxID=1326 RepID=A0A380IDP4_STRAI|nr:Uncharacterised protein [Streptococcus acidominimus]
MIQIIVQTFIEREKVGVVEACFAYSDKIGYLRETGNIEPSVSK